MAAAWLSDSAKSWPLGRCRPESERLPAQLLLVPIRKDLKQPGPQQRPQGCLLNPRGHMRLTGAAQMLHQQQALQEQQRPRACPRGQGSTCSAGPHPAVPGGPVWAHSLVTVSPPPPPVIQTGTW